MAFPPDGGDAICVDDWIAEIRSVWHNVFGGGTVYQLFTPPLTLSGPFDPYAINAGTNHVGAQFNLLPLDSLEIDFNDALGQGQLTSEQFALYMSHSLQAWVVVGTLQGPSGTASVLATIVTFVADGGSSVSWIVVWGRAPMEYATHGDPPLCAVAPCACVFYGHNFELPESLQELYTEFAQQWCEDAQQKLIDIDHDFEVCRAAYGGISIPAIIGGACGGFLVGGPAGACVGAGVAGLGPALALYQCYDERQEDQDAVWQDLDQKLTQWCQALCAVAAQQQP